MKFWGFFLVFLFTLLNDAKGDWPASKPRTCSRRLTSPAGSFISPYTWRQLGRYPGNAKCTWSIAMPSGNVTITFSKFHTEACCDYVTINNEKGDLIGRYSGLRSKFSITITPKEAQRVDITFKSDQSVSGPGFEASYVTHGKPVTRKRSRAVCEQLPDAGNCNTLTRRYYYSSRADACRPFYYGGCVQGHGNNFQKREECKKLCVKRKPLCPPGQRIVYCIVNPCQVETCPAYNATSKCVANYCGGCNAIFYDQHGIPIPHKPGRRGRCHCKKGEKLVHCAVDPCKKATCPSQPNAKCRLRRCGSCVAEFVAVNGTIINNC